MQRFIAIGNLTKDNDFRYAKDNVPMVKNTLAVRRDKENTDFIPFTAFSTTAKILEDYTKKGSKVCIEGEIRTGSYEKDNKKVYTQEILVSRVELLGTKEIASNEVKNDVKQDDPYKDFADEVEIGEEDLPF